MKVENKVFFDIIIAVSRLIMFFATLIIAILGKNHNNLCPAIAKLSLVLIMKIVNIENFNLYSQTVLGFFCRWNPSIYE